MEELKNKIEILRDNLVKIENDEYKKMFQDVYSVLDSMNDKIEELVVNVETLEENFRFMDDDLSGIQDELFEELSIDDLDEAIDDEFTEIKCCHCDKPIFIEKSALSGNNEIPCPYCHKDIKNSYF